MDSWGFQFGGDHLFGDTTILRLHYTFRCILKGPFILIHTGLLCDPYVSGIPSTFHDYCIATKNCWWFPRKSGNHLDK